MGSDKTVFGYRPLNVQTFRLRPEPNLTGLMSSGSRVQNTHCHGKAARPFHLVEVPSSLPRYPPESDRLLLRLRAFSYSLQIYWGTCFLLLYENKEEK